MNTELKKALIGCETDLDEVLERLSGDEDLYVQCLAQFLEDSTVSELSDALAEGAWDDVFTFAHALKGLAANMGFIPLFHASAEMVVIIRAGRMNEMKTSFVEVKRCYDEITNVIKRYADTLTSSQGDDRHER